MEEYTVRYREILILEMPIEAESHKDALVQFKKKLEKGSLRSVILIGVRYEIEGINLTKRSNHDYQPKKDKPRKHPPPRSVRAKAMEKPLKQHYRATDCESGASESGV